MLKVTIFKPNSRRMVIATNQESYRRGILIFEQTIADLEKKLKNAQIFIAKLQAEKLETISQQRLLQIDIDIAHVQNTLNQLQPEVLIIRYAEQLIQHKQEFEKFSH